MMRVWLLLWVITGLICKLNAAAIKDDKTTDLNQTTAKDDAEQTASTYHHSQEYLTMNDSKVVIDLFTPTSPSATDSKSNDEETNGSTAKKSTPIVQLVINKANVIDNTENTTATSTSATSSTTTKPTTTTTVSPTIHHPTTTVSHSPLIPPASVNATIKQLDKGPKAKQGQIIISSEPDCPSLQDADRFSQTQLIKRLVHVCRYDRLERPVSFNSKGQRKPVSVFTRAYIYFMQNLEVHDLQFQIHALLQMRYVDPRLVFQTVAPNRKQPILGQSILRDSLWTPHIFFANERASSVLGTPEKDVLTSVSPDGTVIISTRIQATLHCWMNLQKYPFDEQKCRTVMESWMYNTSELELHWEEKSPITLAPELHLTEYVFVSLWTNRSTINADLSDLRHGAFTGNYSSLSFTLHLSREMGFYVMDYYLPSCMLVSISWVSFWLQADASPPRIMLGTSTMLTFITLASAQGKTLPKVSYIKMSEVWFLGCCFFIFSSLVEFAFVNTIWRRKNNVELKKVNSKYILKSTLTPKPTRKDMGSNLQKSRSCSSLEGAKSSSKKSFDNYLTVHSFPSNKNVPTITTTQSMDDLMQENGSNIGVNMEPLARRKSSITAIPVIANCLPDVNQKQGWTTMTPQEISYWIDRRSRVLFPSAFLVFNIFYWTFAYFF